MRCDYSIFLISDQWVRSQLIVSGTIPELVVLGSIFKKQVEQDMESKSVSSTPP